MDLWIILIDLYQIGIICMNNMVDLFNWLNSWSDEMRCTWRNDVSHPSQPEDVMPRQLLRKHLMRASHIWKRRWRACYLQYRPSSARRNLHPTAISHSAERAYRHLLRVLKTHRLTGSHGTGSHKSASKEPTFTLNPTTANSLSLHNTNLLVVFPHARVKTLRWTPYMGAAPRLIESSQ